MIDLEGSPTLRPVERLKREGNVREVVVLEGLKIVCMPSVGRNGEIEADIFSSMLSKRVYTIDDCCEWR